MRYEFGVSDLDPMSALIRIHLLRWIWGVPTEANNELPIILVAEDEEPYFFDGYLSRN
jgi:hypothetical protein